MTSAPAFQFFARDFEAATAALSPAELGAHIRLICYSWNNGPIPADLAQLASIMRARSPRDAAALWARIQPLWRETSAGYLNDAIEGQRAKQEAFRQRQAANGRHGGRPKDHRSQSNPDQSGGFLAENPPNKPDETQSKALHSAICDLRSADHTQEPDQHTRPTPERRPRRPRTQDVDYSADFLAFWQSYPRRVGKADAWKAWRELDPSPEVRSQIGTALAWQIRQPEWTKENGRFIPHPASWLRDRRWEDEETEPFNLPADDDDQLERVLAGRGRVQ